MEPTPRQFNKPEKENVVSLSAKRDAKMAAKSPFGPIQSGKVKMKRKEKDGKW